MEDLTVPMEVPADVDPFAYLNRGVKFVRGKVILKITGLVIFEDLNHNSKNGRQNPT